MIPYDEPEETIDITKLAATELADHLIDLYEQIQRERKKVPRLKLINEYNVAAKYYNSNIQKNIMSYVKVK